MVTIALLPLLTIMSCSHLAAVDAAKPPSPPDIPGTTTDGPQFRIQAWAGNGRKTPPTLKQLGDDPSNGMKASFYLPSHITWQPVTRTLYVLQPHQIRTVAVIDGVNDKKEKEVKAGAVTTLTREPPKGYEAFTSMTIHPETDEIYVTTKTAIFRLIQSDPIGNCRLPVNQSSIVGPMMIVCAST